MAHSVISAGLGGMERFGPVHDKGSSPGAFRLIRQAYLEDPADLATEGSTRHLVDLFSPKRLR